MSRGTKIICLPRKVLVAVGCLAAAFFMCWVSASPRVVGAASTQRQLPIYADYRGKGKMDGLGRTSVAAGMGIEVIAQIRGGLVQLQAPLTYTSAMLKDGTLRRRLSAFYGV